MNSIISIMATATDVGDIRSAISVAARKMSVTLKEKQLEAVEEYMNGNDTFVSLPTGYGKSLIYGILPSAFASIRRSIRAPMHFSYCSALLVT